LYFVDSTIVKAHRCASRGKGGEKAGNRSQSRRGRTTKTHAVVDTKGCPLDLTVTGGQVHDSQVVEEVLNTTRPPLAVSADKAYDSKQARQQIKDALPVIPRATRYDKLARNFLAATLMIGTLYWISLCVQTLDAKRRPFRAALCPKYRNCGILPFIHHREHAPSLVGRLLVTFPPKVLLSGRVRTRCRLLGFLHSRVRLVVVTLSGERRIGSPNHKGAGYRKRNDTHRNPPPLWC
jgi:hypothetical protein